MKVNIIVSPSIFYTSHPMSYPETDIWNEEAARNLSILSKCYNNSQIFILADKFTEKVPFNYQLVGHIPVSENPYIIIDTEVLNWLRIPAGKTVICHSFYGFNADMYAQAWHKLWIQINERKRQRIKRS